MPDEDPAAMLAALDMGCPAVESPVPLLVAEPALTPSGALLVRVVSCLSAALTAVPRCPDFSTEYFLPPSLGAVVVAAVDTRALS